MRNSIKVGDRFGRWEVIRVDVYRDRWNNVKHRCLCECGTEKPVFENSLRSAMSWSCGCIQKSLDGFGRSHPLYGIWAGIFTRCENENYPQFDLYGGRGIKVCDRWRNFSNFAVDMGDRPSPNHSVEREDNDGDYEPGNCRWATSSEQARNRSSNRLLGYQGRVQCLQDWCDELGLDYMLMHGRLSNGWTVDRAFETPRIRE